jgi:hypothetical protein
MQYFDEENDLVTGDTEVSKQNEAEENGETMPLIFDRFETLEEAHKAFIKAEHDSQSLESVQKELESCQRELASYQQELQARQLGFSGKEELYLNMDVRQKELDNYALAGTYLISPEKLPDFQRLIEACRKQGPKADLTPVRRCFSPDVVALVSEDVALFRHMKNEEYARFREQEQTMRYQRQIEEFRKIDPDFFATDLNNLLTTQAVELSDGRVDLCELKKLVNRIGEEAVRNYQKEQRIFQENEDLQKELAVLESASKPSGDKKWLTREAFNRLRPEEVDQYSDLIAEQIDLEKMGKLPRMLTR